MGRVAVFAPHPLLSITVERRGGGDDVHLHPGGQGVWVSRMAAELGADPVLCGFAGVQMDVVTVPAPLHCHGEQWMRREDGDPPHGSGGLGHRHEHPLREVDEAA